LEVENRKLVDKCERGNDAEKELSDQINLHRGRASALTGELEVAQESLSRANAASKQMNERRLAAEEKLAAEIRATERLMVENGKHTEKINQLNNEVAAMRGARDGDSAAHAASLGAAQAAAERERLSREAAEYRENDVTRRLADAQASLTQEIGGRKGAEAAKQAAEVESANLKSQLEEAEKGVHSLKEELYSLYKVVGDLKEDNHKARGSSLALTMEIDTVRMRMVETKERLEKEIVDLKERCASVEKERGQYLLDNAELRTVVTNKVKEVDGLMAQLGELERELTHSREELLEDRRNTKERQSEHVQIGIAACNDAREVGFQQGFETAQTELRGVMEKMKEEMAGLVAEVQGRETETQDIMSDLKDHDAQLAKELKELDDQLTEREREVVHLKIQLGEKETELMDVKHELEKKIEEEGVERNKNEYALRNKEEMASRQEDEVHVLRKRAMSLEKDLARVEMSQKEYKKEIRTVRRESKLLVKSAVGLVREKVIKEDGDASMFVDDIFGEGTDGGDTNDDRSVSSVSTFGTPRAANSPHGRRSTIDGSSVGGGTPGNLSDSEFSVSSPVNDGSDFEERRKKAVSFDSRSLGLGGS
jgi:chromosome segregation ATPase